MNLSHQRIFEHLAHIFEAHATEATVCGMHNTCFNGLAERLRSAAKNLEGAGVSEKSLVPAKPQFWPGPGGALLCDREISGVTQRLDFSSGKYYHGEYMVGETICRSAAQKIAAVLGGEWRDQPPEKETCL